MFPSANIPIERRKWNMKKISLIIALLAVGCAKYPTQKAPYQIGIHVYFTRINEQYAKPLTVDSYSFQDVGNAGNHYTYTVHDMDGKVWENVVDYTLTDRDGK